MGGTNPMLFNVEDERLRELLNDFYILTNMRLNICNDDATVVMAFPAKHYDFCNLIRLNNTCNEACKKCDIAAYQKVKSTKKINIYQCHIGLTEVVAPIIYNDIVLGYIIFGKIVEKGNEAENKKNVLENCSKYTTELDQLSKHYDILTKKSHDQILAAAKIVESIACFIWVSELVKIGDESLFLKIDNYISENITSSITIDKICDNFSISRSKLYEISNKYFGLGIAQYIRKMRLQKAISLLENEQNTAKEICSLVGIDDYKYFLKMFKKETGVGIRTYSKSRNLQ